MLKELAASRTAPAREVERAKILLGYTDGATITELQRRLGIARTTIYKCIDKALASGVAMGLKDKYHRPYAPEISDEAKAWVTAIACTKPKNHGMAAELWTLSALAQFANVPRPLVLRAWPRRAKRPCGASLTTTISNRTKFVTI